MRLRLARTLFLAAALTGGIGGGLTALSATPASALAATPASALAATPAGAHAAPALRDMPMGPPCLPPNRIEPDGSCHFSRGD